jgi:hypothetical protein
MAGGSRQPDGPDEYQCQNCGRWYARIGLSQHEASCSHPEWADPLVELVDVDVHPMMKPTEEIDEPTDQDEFDDLDDDQVPEPVVDESPAPAETAATDGGNPIFDGPDPDPNPATTDGGDPDDDPTCPECGGNVFFDASEHTQFEFGCPTCSTDEEWVVWDE